MSEPDNERALRIAAKAIDGLRVENARLRRLSVRVFEDCGTCVTNDRSIPVTPTGLSCATCKGTRKVLRDGAWDWYSVYRGGDGYWFPASMMEEK